MDLLKATDAGPEVRTLFFAPRQTQGAALWLEHFHATSLAARLASPYATPVLRSENVIFYAGEADLERRVSKLQATVAEINLTYGSRLESSADGKLRVPTIETISNAVLNQLHFEFEAFGDRFKSSDSEDKEAISSVYGPFCRLNDEIHACEGALANRGRTRDEAWWALHASFLPDVYRALPDNVYPEFTLDWKFGTLFMGYHTLGKDITAAFWNDDMALFERDEIRPQRISSCELFCFFGPGTEGQLEQMEAWWRERDIERYGFRWGDPSNGIGYIPVADLVTFGLTQQDIKNELAGSSHLLAASVYAQ